MTSTRPCPLCFGVECEVLHTQEFVLTEGHPLSSGYNVVTCESCGFVYADTTGEQRIYDQFYKEHSKYDHPVLSSGGGSSNADKKRLQETVNEISKHLTNKDARILDVGCASGGLLCIFREFGFNNLYGIDPSKNCVDQAKKYGHVSIGSLNDIPVNIGLFDLIVLSHVIEHVRDFAKGLLSLTHLLMPGERGGGLYVEVPDATKYSSYFVSPFHYFDTEHINHFSPITLSRAMQSAGLAVIVNGTKLTPLTDEVMYPACWALGKQQPSTVLPVEYMFDAELPRAIKSYIDLSRNFYDIHILQQLADSGSPVIVWGVGCSTTRLLAESPLAKANIVAFVDNNPSTWGKTLFGRKILKPEQLKEFTVPILITSKLYSKAIYSQLQDVLHLSNDVLLMYDLK